MCVCVCERERERWETVKWQNHHGVDLKLQLISDSLSPVQVG